MAKMQLRLYVETTDENYTRERQLLTYLEDQFNDDYVEFAGDVKADKSWISKHMKH